MRLLRVAAGVVNQTPLDWEGNRDRLLSCIESARAHGAALLCLPELCIPGYGCEDAFHSPDVLRQSWRVLQELLPATHGMVVSLGLPVRHRGGLFNCAAVVCDGVILGLVAKRHLAGDGLHYEPRWFKAWPRDVQGTADVEGHELPIGDLHFDVGGLRIGFEICEDAWVATRPGAELSRLGIDVILNPSASHFAFGKDRVRRRFVLEGSRAFGVTYVYSNLLGNEAGRAIYDGGAMVASGGTLIASGPRFSFAEADVLTATVDLDATRMQRARTASFEPDLATDPGLVEVDFAWPRGPEDPQVSVHEPRPDLSKEEAFARAVALALHDYQRKARSRGFVVSLSGGADSAAVAILAWLSAKLCADELGLDELNRRLGTTAESVAALIPGLLCCAYQPTENSGDITLNAATGVAEGLGATFHVLDVDALWKGYRTLIEGALGRELSWATDDLALQNIQARVRAPSVWMLANVRNALLLATSNRSEAAVGYATMDGDTCGGVSPIAGIDKAFLLSWLRWMQREGLPGIGPLPWLHAITVQAPTAELRPPEDGQTDEGDLMPYPLLDAIERAAIRDKGSPVEVWRTVRVAFPQYTGKQLGAWVERFFRLWTRNQWKRERYAPSFHVDDENLDPKTWCRFPILSGGYARELGELARLVAADG